MPAVGMEHTEVAVIDYRPKDWPSEAVRCIARRTVIPHEQIPTGRARKRRTIPQDQLALALQGRLEHVYGYSFILTNLDVSDAENLAQVEWCYRHRTDIEALNKDAKLGAALRHLPSADHRVNTVWMWAALLACALSSWLQEIAGIDYGNGRGRRTLTRLRRELIAVPARLTRSAGTTYLRLPPRDQLLDTSCPGCKNCPAQAEHDPDRPHHRKGPRGGTPPTRRDSRALDVPARPKTTTSRRLHLRRRPQTTRGSGSERAAGRLRASWSLSGLPWSATVGLGVRSGRPPGYPCLIHNMVHNT